MRQDNLTGYFDVREYNAKKAVQERAIKSDDATITFGVAFAPEQLPKELSDYAKACESKKDGHKYMLIKFKIGSRCRWFARNEKGVVAETARPTNADLDGNRYECCIDYKQLNGDPNKQEAYGYWANAILIAEAQSNYFADLNAETVETAEQSAIAAGVATPTPTIAKMQDDTENNDKLPF